MLDWGIVNIKTSFLSILYDLPNDVSHENGQAKGLLTHPKISSLSTLYYLNNMTQIELGKFYSFKSCAGGGGLYVTLYLCNMKE